jgi:hypothetical protein
MLGQVDPASFQGTAPAAPARPAPSRVRTLVTHPERSAAVLAILIGFASVFSAVLAWQASLASIDASRYQSLAVQQQARREQIEREIEGTVEQDQRFVAAYQEHALAARELQSQADAIRATDAQAADALDVEAQSESAQARALQPFFTGATGIHLADDGTVPYDKTFVLRNLQDSNLELRDLTTSNVNQLAEQADTKSIQLVAVAAVIIAALFFLTVAQVSRTRPRIRQMFFVAGALLVISGTLLFLLVEVAG